MIVGKVQVYIGHGDTSRVEKALKDEAKFERIQPGEAQAVSHNTTVTGTAHIPPNAALAGVADEVPVDEEIGVETHLVNDAQFVVQPLPYLRSNLRIASF